MSKRQNCSSAEGEGDPFFPEMLKNVSHLTRNPTRVLT